MSDVSSDESDPGDGDKPIARSDDVLKKGDVLGRYLVLEPLGAGAMGVVYAAYDPELDRKIAIKILRPQEGKGDRGRRQERLVREAKAMAKLSHPNVGAIYDVGVHGDQVFLAMEFLSGGTLRNWVTSKKRPWREIVKMFIEVGKGLAGAHAEGLIHRDFKPDNVLLDKNGVPKVVDFGLVRLNSAALDRSTTGSMEVTAEDEAVALPLAQTVLAADLTRTGALTGTPAYMAPEQFLGKAIDARTDQFAFCVALYEALFGERPFAGDTVIGIAESVTDGRLRPLPANVSIPPWVRRVVLTGLHTKPADRYPSVEAVVAALLDDPQVRRRKRLIVGSALLAAVATIVYFRVQAANRRAQTEGRARALVSEARTHRDDARRADVESIGLRSAAFTLFDAGNWTAGEKQWRATVSREATAEDGYRAAQNEVEAARGLFPLDGTQDLLEEIVRARMGLAERTWRLSDRAALRAKLEELVRAGSPVAVSPPAALTLHTTPAGAEVEIETSAAPPRRLGTTPLESIAVPEGAHRLVIRAAGRARTVYPIRVTGAEKLSLSITLLDPASVPPGFVYVPEGRFFFGTKDEDLRTSFLDTTPIHQRSTGSFFIATTEVTFADWIAFLDHLPPAERQRRIPTGLEPGGGFIRLEGGPGEWRIDFRPYSARFKAQQGHPLVYTGRDHLRQQDWLKMPVTGIASGDAEAFVAWLRRTRLPTARICSETEWERAARGADDREYPHGDSVAPEDANIDIAHGRQPLLFGLDEVGQHPRSRSPFGLDDMVGNANELTRSAFVDGAYVIRGGSYYQNANTARSTNRGLITTSLKAAAVGLRLCADVPTTP